MNNPGMESECRIPESGFHIQIHQGILLPRCRTAVTTTIVTWIGSLWDSLVDGSN